MDEIIALLSGFRRRLEKLERFLERRRVVVPSDGVLVAPVDTSEPSSPTNGQIFYNSSTHKLRVYANSTWTDLH